MIRTAFARPWLAAISRAIRIVLWLLMSLILLATVLAVFARAGFPFELATNFRPVYIVLALGAGLIAVLPRWWRLALVCLGLLVWNSAAIHLIPATAPRLAADEAADMTVIWFNTLSRDQAVEGVAALAEEVGADAIFFAEASPSNRAVMERLLPAYDCRSTPDGNRWDTAAFARSEPCQAHPVAFPEPRADTYEHRMARLIVDGVDIRGRHVTTPLSRRRERARNAQIASGAHVEAPGLLVGDFNATMWSPPILDLQRKAGLKRVNCGGPYAFSWPAGARIPPIIRIDHAFVTEGLAARCEVGPNLGSDHYPLIVRIKRMP